MPVFADRQEIKARIVADTDSVHAEPVRVEPMKGGGDYGQPVADPERPPIADLQAVLRIHDGDRDLGGRGEEWHARAAIHHATLRVDHAKLPDGFVFAKGDHIVAASRPGAPRFQVDRLGKAKRSRLLIMLSEIG